MTEEEEAELLRRLNDPSLGHAAAPLDVAQNFFGLEAINGNGPRMMTGPIAFPLA